VCDYAPSGLEFAEIVSKFQHFLKKPNEVRIHQVSTPSLDTIAVGFVTYQLAMAKRSNKVYIYGNSAPRRKNAKAVKNNLGSGVVYARLKNGVEIMNVYSDYSLSFVRDQIVEFRDVDCKVAGSQFRSRDFFPEKVARLIDGDRTMLTKTLDPKQITPVPHNLIVWTDGFGNIKTSMRLSDLEKQGFTSGEKVQVILNGVSMVGVISIGGFAVERGVLAVNAGSSGYDDPFIELFLRVHHLSEKPAAVRFNYPVGGTLFELKKL
jgi:hypothetical protein